MLLIEDVTDCDSGWRGLWNRIYCWAVSEKYMKS